MCAEGVAVDLANFGAGEADVDRFLDDLLAGGDPADSTPAGEDTGELSDGEAGFRFELPDDDPYACDQIPVDKSNRPDDLVTAVSRDEDTGEAFRPATPEVPAAVADSTPGFDPYTGLDDDGDDDDELEPSKPSLLERIKTQVQGASTHTKALCAAGAIAVLVVVAVVMVQGDSDTPAPSAGTVVARDESVPATGTSGVAASTAPQNLVDVIDFTEAKCPRGGNDQRLAFSTEDSEAWVCPRAGGLDGQILNIAFTRPVTITSIRFVPGFNYVAQPAGDDMWNQYRVVTDVLWGMGGRQFYQEVTPARTTVEYTPDQPVTTTRMSMTIQNSVEPEKTVGGENFDQLGGLGGSGPTHDAVAIQHLEIMGTVAR